MVKPLRNIVAALFCMGVSAAAPIQTLSPNQTVSGVVRLSPGGDLSGVASVEYRMGNYRIGIRTGAPFSMDWNSALASDGHSQIEAIARDPFGNTVSDTSIPVVFQNYGNKAEVLNGLPAALSGVVPLSLHAFDSAHYPAYWEVSIDGELITPRYTDQSGKNDLTLAETLDTTGYPNGMHEFYFVFHSNDFGNANPPPGNENYRGMVMQNVDLENGRTFMEVVANYLHVYVPVGGTLTLGCRRAYTNGDRDACQTPQYSAADSTVASVDGSGTLKALREGFTDVTVTEGGKTTVAHVWVENSAGIPHFTTNGGMSTAFAAGRSGFIIAPFGLAPQTLALNPPLLGEIRRAGVNTLTRGIYLNPLELTTSFDVWKQGFDALALPDYQLAAADKLRIIGVGDDIARNIGTEAWRTLNWPPAKQAVQYAMQQFAQSGTAVSAEIIDEGSFLWGPNPQPPGVLGRANSMQSIVCSGATCTVTWPGLSDNTWHDSISAGLTFTLTGNAQLNTPAGKFYTAMNVSANTFDFTPATSVTGSFTPQTAGSTEFEWFARAQTCPSGPCIPPVLNSALAIITSWLKSAPAAVPVSYPAGGIASTATQRNWMGQGSISDYASHYWDTGQQRPTYVFGKGIRETSYYMLSGFYNRQPFMQLNRPQLMLIGMSGTSFIKNSPAGSFGFQPPVDQLQNVAAVPRSIGSSMFAAAAAGAAGFRIYQFEDPAIYQAQKAAGPGTAIQIGGAPVYGDVAIWRSMAYSANMLTKVLEPYVLGVPLSSPALGRNVITGARQSGSGKMLMIVNGWDGGRDVSVDFRPFRSGFEGARYRVNDTYVKTAVLADSEGETVRMEAGETLVYVFPNSVAPALLDGVTFQPPVDAAGSPLALRYGYVYGDDVKGFGDVLDCTGGCSIAVDRRIGAVYYQYTLIDQATGKMQASQVLNLGAGGTVMLGSLNAGGARRR